jgi:homocysteine S-methyltransferase
VTNIILLDGGMGQELLRRSTIPEHPLWSAKVLMDEPDLVQAVHADFIDAGARVITINAYSATPERLAHQGVPDFFQLLQARAIDLAQAARDSSGQNVRVAGCLPPLYTSYRPEMATNFEENLDLYRQIVVEQADRVDLFICETLGSIVEARAALIAAAETDLPVWLGLSVKDDATDCLRSGEPLAQAIDFVLELEPEAVLLNCSTPEAIGHALSDFDGREIPWGAYANGFTDVAALEQGGLVDVLSVREDLPPAAYAKHALSWVDSGARIVGGCCEVGPAHIRELRNALQKAGHLITGTLSS